MSAPAEIVGRVALAEIIAAVVYCSPGRSSEVHAVLSEGAFKLADVFVDELRARGLQITEVGK
jgi:anion-transporting  ArsA/GET3 family ATPase